MAEITKIGISDFCAEIKTYIDDPTTPGRRKLMNRYKVTSADNTNFQTIIDTFQEKYRKRFDAEWQDECHLEKFVRIGKIFTNQLFKLDESSLKLLLESVHKQNNTDSPVAITQFFTPLETM